jgi:hypothetical protein
MSTITDYLTEDHRRLHELLDRSDADGIDGIDGESFAAFRAGLLRHIGIEEKLLLPAVKRRLGAPLEAAMRLRMEHAALTSLMVPSPDRALIREIRWLLDRHDAREEGPDGVYGACAAALAEENAALYIRARDQKPVPVSAYYDGPEAHRTAAGALASAERITAARTPRK